MEVTITYIVVEYQSEETVKNGKLQVEYPMSIDQRVTFFHSALGGVVIWRSVLANF